LHSDYRLANLPTYLKLSDLKVSQRTSGRFFERYSTFHWGWVNSGNWRRAFLPSAEGPTVRWQKRVYFEGRPTRRRFWSVADVWANLYCRSLRVIPPDQPHEWK